MDLKELWQSFIEEVLSLTDRLLDRIPEERRRLFLWILAGLVFIAICLTTAAIVIGRRTQAIPQVITAGIPAEELFYPEEPDFLPPLLIEREPHQPWTINDLELYWQDPKAGNEEKWKEAVKSMVDEILNGVP